MNAGDRLWFTPAPAARLAGVRIVVGAFSLWYLGRRVRMLRRLAATDAREFEPVGPVRILDRPLPVPVVQATTLATLGAAAAFTLGWRHRVTGPAFSTLLLWTLSYRNSWSMIFHTDNSLVLHALVLGVTPAADAWSLDAASGRAAGAGAGGTLTGDRRYGWPLQLMTAASTSAYALSGLAKLVGPRGGQWVRGDALRAQIAVDGVRKELGGGRATPVAYAMYDHPLLFRLAALGTVILELGAPLALVSRRVARPIALALFGMHWGIRAVMGINFRYPASGAAFAPFVDLDRVVASAARLLGR